MTKNVRFDQLTRTEISKVSKDSLMILPLGAIEQHGEHLNMGVDTFLIEALAERCCQEVRKVFPAYVAPVMPYGNSHHHRPYPTISLSSEVLLAVIKDILRSLSYIGFKHMIILNGHGGNDEVIRIATRDIAKEQSVNIGSASYWTIAWQRLQKINADRLGRIPGHAGGFETSLMLALDERQVKLERRPELRNDTVPKQEMKNRMYVQTGNNSVGEGGISDDASKASKEFGKEVLEVIVEEVSKELINFKEIN